MHDVRVKLVLPTSNTPPLNAVLSEKLQFVIDMLVVASHITPPYRDSFAVFLVNWLPLTCMLTRIALTTPPMFLSNVLLMIIISESIPSITPL